MVMPRGNYHSGEWFSSFSLWYAPERVSLAVPETVTGLTFKRITIPQRNSASTQMTVSVHGLKHLYLSKIHVYYPYVD